MIIVNKPLLIIGFILMASTLKPQDSVDINYFENIEISSGFTYLIYQSGYGFKSSPGIEILVSKRLVNSFKPETGFRFTLNPILPEVFIRGIIYQEFNSWQPAIGLETGITWRADFESSKNLLKESREAMLKNVGNLYLSAHIELLSFNIKNKLNISLLEIDIGTHYKNFGRTLRAQTILIRLRTAI